MSDTAYLALLLDAPLQSWGFSSRFQRRTTELHPDVGIKWRRVIEERALVAE